MAIPKLDAIKLRPINAGASVLAPPTLDINSYDFQYKMKLRVAEMQAERADRYKIKSLWDVFANKKGRETAVDYYAEKTGLDLDKDNNFIRTISAGMKLADNLYYGIPSKLIDTLQGDMQWRDNLDVGQELGSNVMNWLYMVGDTLDFLSFFVKSGIISRQENISYSKALEMSFGTGEDGRERMDFQRIADNSEFWGDGFFPVMLGELITDPLLVFALGKGLLTGAGKMMATLSKNSDDIFAGYFIRKFAPAAKKFVSKTAIETSDDISQAAVKSHIKTGYRLNEAIKYNKSDDYIKIIDSQLKAKHISLTTAFELKEEFAYNASKFKASGAMRFLTAADDIENRLIRRLGKMNPMIAPMRGIYKGAKYLRYKDASIKGAVDFANGINYTLSEYEKMDVRVIEDKLEALKDFVDEGFATGKIPGSNKAWTEVEADQATKEWFNGNAILNKKNRLDELKIKTNDLKTHKDKLAELKKFDLENASPEKAFENNEHIKVLEAQIADLEDDVAEYGGLWEKMRRAETLTKDMDFDEASKVNWSKYSDEAEYNNLSKSIDDLKLDRRAVLDERNNLKGNKKKFQQLKDEYNKLQDLIKPLEKKKELADIIHYLIRHAAYGTKHSENIVHLVNKGGNDTLKKVMQIYSKGITKSHETLTKGYQTWLDETLQFAREGLENIDVSATVKTLEEYKIVADRIDRLRALLGDDIVEDADTFYNIGQTYTNLVAKINESKISKQDEYRTAMYRFTQMFDRWFDGSYNLNRSALNDRVSTALEQVNRYKPDAKNADSVKHLEWTAELDEANAILQAAKELDAKQNVTPIELLKLINQNLKVKKLKGGRVKATNNLAPPALAASFKVLDKLYQNEMYKIVIDKIDDITVMSPKFRKKLLERQDILAESIYSTLKETTIPTKEIFRKEMSEFLEANKFTTKADLLKMIDSSKGDKFFADVMDVRRNILEFEDVTKYLESIQGDQRKMMLYALIAPLKEGNYVDILNTAEYRPRMFLTYLENANNGKLMPQELAYFMENAVVLRRHARMEFKNFVSWNNKGRMVVDANYITDEGELLVATYNNLMDFVDTAKVLNRDNVGTEIVKQYKKMHSTMEDFHKLRAEEELLAIEALEQSAVSTKQIMEIMEREFDIEGLEFADLSNLKIQLVGHVKVRSLETLKSTIKELGGGHGFGVIHETMEHLEIIKKFKIPYVSRAIKMYSDGLVKPLLRWNREPAKSVAFFKEQFLQNTYYKQLVDGPQMTDTAMAAAEMSRRIKEIENFLELSVSELEKPYVESFREAYATLRHADLEMPKGPSIFTEFINEGSDAVEATTIFRKTPFDDMSADSTLKTKVFRKHDGSEVTADIRITSRGIEIDGQPARTLTGDAETQGDLPFQFSLKNGVTGENKIYYIMTETGKIDPKTAQYTGITDEFYQELIKDKQVFVTVEEFKLQVLKDFPDSNMFIAHNATFDMKYMPTEFQEKMIVMDSLPLLRLIYNDKHNRFGLESIAKAELKDSNYLEELTKRLKGEVAQLLEGDFQLDKVNFHNANFDTEVLHKLLFQADETGNLNLFTRLQDYGITDMKELNDSKALFFKGDAEKALDSAKSQLDNALESFYGIKGSTFAQKGMKTKLVNTFQDVMDSLNISETGLMYQADAIYDDLMDLQRMLYDPNVSIDEALKLLIDIEYSTKTAMNYIGLSDTPGLYTVDLDSLPEAVTNLIKTANDVTVEIQGAFRIAAERQSSILDKFYGNATGSLIRSKFYAHSLIMSHLATNRPMRKIGNFLSNIEGIAESPIEKELRSSMAFHKAQMLDQLVRDQGLVPPKIRDPKAVQSEFNKVFPDHPLVKLEEFIKDINKYEDVQNETFEMIKHSKKFNNMPEEEERNLAYVAMYDLMYNTDKAVARMFTREEVPDINELRMIYNQLSIQTGANKFIDKMSAKDTKAFNIVDRDALEFYWKSVVERFDRISEEGLSSPKRLLLNPDTRLSNDMYYKLKDYFTDVVHTIDSKTKTAIKRDEFSGRVLETTIDRQTGAIAKQMDEYFGLVIADLRQPLKDIKVYNRVNEFKPMHVGQMRELWYDAVNAKSASEGMNWWRNADVTSESSLATLGAQNAVKLSRSTSEVQRVKKSFYDLLDGLTPEQKSIQSIGDEIAKTGEGAFFKDLDFSESKGAQILNEMFEKLGYEGTLSDFLKYAKSNQAKTHYRMMKVEQLDNLIEIAEHDTEDTFGSVREAWNLIQEWIDHPYTTYLKTDELVVDPEALAEFGYRFKATMYDYIFETDGLKLTDEMSKGFSQANIMDEGAKAGRKMTINDLNKSQSRTLNNARPHFEDTYRNIRALFFDRTEEGIQKFIKFANDNDYSLAYQVQGKYGVQLKKFTNLTPETVRQFDALYESSHGAFTKGSQINNDLWGIGALEKPLTFGLLDTHQFQTLQKVLKDTFKFPVGSWQQIARRALLAPLKVMSLFSANFTLGNAVDITLKNMKTTEGGITQSFTLVKNTYRAMKMHSMYTKYYDDAVKMLDFGTYDNFSKEWIEAYSRRLDMDGKLTAKIKQELEVVEHVNEFVKTEAAASEMNEMLMRMRMNKIGKAHQDSKWQYLMNKVFFSKWGTDSSLNYNPFSANLQFNGLLETVGRLGLHLDNISKGVSKNESLNRILKTHFNYSNKSQAEMYAEFVVPFISYPLRSFDYWSEALFEKGIETRALFKALEVAWGDNLDDNSYAQYQMSRGNIPVGDHILQTGFTFMDAMQMGTMSGNQKIGGVPLPDQLVRKMNPLIKSLGQSGLTDEQRINRLPVLNQGRKIANIPTAIKTGSIDEIFPSVSDPYFSNGFANTRSSFQYRNPYQSGPADSQSVSFKMFGKYMYSPMDRMNYRWTNTQKFYK